MPRPSLRAQCLTELSRQGGAADIATLIAASSRAALRSCLAAGEIVSLGGGWAIARELGHHLKDPPKAPAWHLEPQQWPDSWLALLAARKAVAASRRACLALRCAALQHGWAILHEPTATELAVPHGRKERRVVREHGPVTVVRRGLCAGELSDRVTSPLRTVLDCAATLPLRDALAIADSALRSGDVGALELAEAAARHPRARVATPIVELASPLAANPFESAMRAMTLDIQGARFEPQLEIVTPDGVARVDLGEPNLRIALEADSYLFHGSHDEFRRDMRRYNAVAALDWAIIRVGFRDLMQDPAALRAQVQSVVWERGRRT